MEQKLDFEGAKKYLLGRLTRELSPHLYYHGVHHTRDNVLPAFERIAKLEGVNGEDLIVGKTAALYHDAGYLKQYKNNEPVGVRIAQETLPGFGYAPNQIGRVGEVIISTQLQMIGGKLVQNPDKKDLLQMIMCDSDLDHLGREDFFKIGDSLRLELIAYGEIAINTAEWYMKQLEFLQNHSYFTQSAQNLRNEIKRKNITKIWELLSKLS